MSINLLAEKELKEPSGVASKPVDTNRQLSFTRIQEASIARNLLILNPGFVDCLARLHKGSQDFRRIFSAPFKILFINRLTR
jgi:hypothetical protein